MRLRLGAKARRAGRRLGNETKKILRRSGLIDPDLAAPTERWRAAMSVGDASGGYRVHTSERVSGSRGRIFVRVEGPDFCESRGASALVRGQDYPVLESSIHTPPVSAEKAASIDQLRQRQSQTPPTRR